MTTEPQWIPGEYYATEGGKPAKYGYKSDDPNDPFPHRGEVRGEDCCFDFKWNNTGLCSVGNGTFYNLTTTKWADYVAQRDCKWKVGKKYKSRSKGWILITGYMANEDSLHPWQGECSNGTITWWARNGDYRHGQTVPNPWDLTLEEWVEPEEEKVDHLAQAKEYLKDVASRSPTKLALQNILAHLEQERGA